jgi:hypothetical protein
MVRTSPPKSTDVRFIRSPASLVPLLVYYSACQECDARPLKVFFRSFAEFFSGVVDLLPFEAVFRGAI